MRWIGGLLVATLLALGGEAYAGDVSCFWRSLPPAAQANYLASYARMGPDASKTAFSTEDVSHAITACHFESVPAELLGRAVADDLWGIGAASALRRQFGVDEQKVMDAWNALPNDQRAAFQQQVLGADSKPDMATVNTILATLHLPDTAQGQVFVYITSRIMLVDAQAKF